MFRKGRSKFPSRVPCNRLCRGASLSAARSVGAMLIGAIVKDWRIRSYRCSTLSHSFAQDGIIAFACSANLPRPIFRLNSEQIAFGR